jgi:aspartyl/asparaginyl-tRNA synthetase
MQTNQTDPLEAFVDESIRLFAKRDYYPTEFMEMRKRYGGTVPAIEQLVKKGEIQSGFKRIQKLDMLERSMEGTVRRFPDRFTQQAREMRRIST